MKIVYICGLGHSGSTILDMALGAHPCIVGLGEVNQVLKAEKADFQSQEFTDILCSCGHNMQGCLFWSKVRDNILQSEPTSLTSKYEDLLAIFSSTFGKDKILVDSSKDLPPYLLDLNKNHDLKIVFLVRDFRSWSYSIHKKKNKKIFTLPLRWRRKNNKLLSFLKKNDLDYFMLGYEEFALYPDIMLEYLCRYIGVEFNECMLRPAGSASHVIRGNSGRADPDKTQAIRYDARWMASTGAAWLNFLYFPLIAYNNRMVFSNFLQQQVHSKDSGMKNFLIFNNRKKI